jgi:murein L,D-transpeptidase YcbB/YkuD
VNPEKTPAARVVPDSTESSAILHVLVDEGYLPDLRGSDVLDYRAELKRFYETADYSPAWVRNRKPTPQALALIQVLQDAANQGLLPKDYDSPLWSSRLAMLDRLQPLGEQSDQARFDVALTVSAMRYISDLHGGRVIPGRLQYALTSDHADFDLAEFLRRQIVEAVDVETSLKQLEPPFPAYRRTVQALETYSKLAREDQEEEELLPIPSKAVRPGDRYEGIPRLVRLLRRLGDLSATAKDREALYDGELIDAVKRFQGRHGLDPDGVIGRQTLKALNTPLQHRVLQLQLALERWRWLPHEFGRPPIIVNIPEFSLHAYNQELQPALSMKLVVGRANKHQTPLFASEIKHVIFRPPWNVPRSIQVKELVPQIVKDPQYVRKGNYEIIDRQGMVVSEGEVNEEILKALRSGKLALRQRPGVNNSLGLVKFVFPNEYDVYMHGTPAVSLFSRSRRDFSHGCIRVEAPAELAAWVLQGQPEWTPARIQTAMNGEETLWVSLDRPVPVLILYTTAAVQEDGEVRFFEDIYNQDAVLGKAVSELRSAPE